MRKLLPAILWTLFTSAVLAADGGSADRQKLDFFEKKIRPILVQHCYECHSGDPAGAQGGLLVDSRNALIRGGDSGAAVVPGGVEQSLLVLALRYHKFEMPPEGKLPDRVIADFETWIRDGAIDPRLTAIGQQPRKIDIDDGRAHWAYQPVARREIPPVKNVAWPINDIDYFILASLESENLQPATDADKRTLIRRLYFDLIGLPPTPEEIANFVEDSSPDAYEQLVEGLLQSPRFGERWGRHWLDIARFAESFTLRGLLLTEAWRYRDYVIDSFNRDHPYDQFIVEQLAGDLLISEANSVEQQRRLLTATTLLMMGNSNLENQNKAQLEMDLVDEQLARIIHQDRDGCHGGLGLRQFEACRPMGKAFTAIGA